MLGRLCTLICSALSTRWSGGASDLRTALHKVVSNSPKYDADDEHSVRALCAVAPILLCFPSFWALYNQSGSACALPTRARDVPLDPNLTRTAARPSYSHGR